MQGRTVGIAIVVVILIGGGLFYIYQKNKSKLPQTATPTTNTNLGLNASTNTNSSAISTSNLTNVDPKTIFTRSGANYAVAIAKVQDWHNDAKIVAFSVKIPTDLNPDTVEESYVFISESEPANFWVITISQKNLNFIRFITPKTDYLTSDLKPIDSRFYKIGYAEAFQIAEKNGGKNIRESGGGAVSVSTILQTGDPNGWLWWTVTYANGSTKQSSSIKINASSGEVGVPFNNTTTTNSS